MNELEKYKTQEKLEDLRSPIKIKEIKTVVKKFLAFRLQDAQMPLLRPTPLGQRGTRTSLSFNKVVDPT